MFNFTLYNSVGYLSSESMITTNIDHLFQCGFDALCGTSNDKHHQIYHNNQLHIRKILDLGGNAEYILYNNNGQIIHDSSSVFDDNIFLIKPEHDLYIDMFTFITINNNKYGSSYLSEYFYHYCKGNGYPINKQTGEYMAPKVSFISSKCIMNKEVSKSPFSSIT